MNLNCLTCTQALRRTDSYKDNVTENTPSIRKVRCIQVERSWSGNIAPPECEGIRDGAIAKMKRQHRRVHSAATAYPGSPDQPRLVRSPGMRRDWSFENLAEQNDKRVMCR